MSFLSDTIICTAVACAMYYAWDKFSNHNSTHPPDHDQNIDFDDGYNFSQKTTFKEVSQLWTQEKVYFSEISKIWRKPEPQEPPKLEVPEFLHKSINMFWRRYIGDKKEFTPERRLIISSILHILDEQGDCSSVVNQHKLEVERNLSPTDYALLEKVTLLDHSLRVTELFVKSTPHDVMAPDAIIIGLGHDLGKIPSVYGKYYATGDHPILSRFILDNLKELKDYHRRKEILSVIEEHHLSGSKYDTAHALRASDKEARQIELGKVIADDMDNSRPDTLPVVPQFPLEATNAPFTTMFNTPDLVESTRKPPGSMRMQKGRTASPPPAWFNEDVFRKELRSRINLVLDGNWQAVSMPDGIVWVKFNTLNEAIQLASGNLPEVRGLGVDRAAQSALALSILTACENCLVDSILREGESATKCMVTTGKGRSMSMFLTPIKAQWFLTRPSELEAAKDDEIKRMVQKVEVNRQ